jgi:aspartyl/asparaginyl beta-hydroxylase (cupin superfamily)
MKDAQAPALATISSLLEQADQLTERGAVRDATAYYTEALRLANMQERWPPALAGRLANARDAVKHFTSQYQTYLLEHLVKSGFDPARSSRRFGESLEIMLGRKQTYMQRPRFYFFPGLPQIQFYGRELFSWLPQVEAATDAIRDELQQLINEPELFQPYIQGAGNRPITRDSGLLNNPLWSACYLWKNGNPVMPMVKRCPNTIRALAGVPLAYMPDRSPSILFSVLKAGARIPPHNGLINTRLICHLPLIVPARCGFRVGNEVRAWEYGKAFLFDDTIEHEAWNESDETRYVLLFDVWRPELTAEEQQLLVGLFKAIDEFQGQPPTWSI